MDVFTQAALKKRTKRLTQSPSPCHWVKVVQIVREPKEKSPGVSREQRGSPARQLTDFRGERGAEMKRQNDSKIRDSLGVRSEVTAPPWILMRPAMAETASCDCQFNSLLTTENEKKDKKHSENADTSMSVTFDLYVWPWPYFKVKNTYVIRCRFLYCTLVPGMVSMNIIANEIWSLIHFLWPLTFTCDLQLMSRSLSFLLLDGRYVVVYWFQVWSL